MIHLLHSCVLALVFYLLYYFFFKGTQGFQTHRIYLLAIPFVSFLLPLLVIPVDNFIIQDAIVMQDTAAAPEVMMSLNNAAFTTVQPSQFDLTTSLWTLYGIGTAAALLLFLYKLARIYQWKEEGQTRYIDGFYITTVHKLPTAFSFLNHIYINDAFAKAEYDQILLHEKTHVIERHSWDLLFYEALRIVFWFHPISYLAQKELKMIHEHIADEKTIAVHGKKSYYENLLKQVLDCPDFSFSNPFFKYKTIKTRIAMTQKNQISRFPVRKLLWMLPVLFASLTYTACTTEQEPDEEITAKTIELTDLPTLQDHVYGQKDFYKGVTDKERSKLENISKEMPLNFENDKKDLYKSMQKFLTDPAYAEYRAISQKISRNGNTVVRDTENNNYILTIHETPKGTPSFSGTGPIDQARMSKEEYLTFIAEQKAKYENQGENNGYEEIVQTETIEENLSAPSNNDTNLIIQNGDVPFAIIEEVPTYPGCTGNNAEKKKCMQENITRFVNKNFNTGLANDLSLTGKQTIAVQFKIDKNGLITGVQSRAKAPELQTEAARVINMLPKMKPGMQRGKEVGVIYGLPIIFEVQ
ncbi:M56 family metallopeptidase [Nonlabens antarcticus]|uniref:M56 family metallopeptidase n=1 Tax=Nonlabens antarcticus TaxID=392714 RepID=UPI001890FC24|nr:M56 family metallopeptidase [Nonlabens antarcticus]